MSQNDLQDLEAARHAQQVNRAIEHDQALNLEQKQQSIARANQNASVARVVNIVYLVFGALQLLLVVRILLQLTGANAGNGFADFIYSLSSPFVALFSNLVQNPTFGNNAVFEITTVFAMLFYAIVAWLVGRAIWLVLSRPR